MIQKKSTVNRLFLQLSGGVVAGVVILVVSLLGGNSIVHYLPPGKTQETDGLLIVFIIGGYAALFIGSMYCWARVLVRFGMLTKQEIKDYVFLRLGNRNE